MICNKDMKKKKNELLVIVFVRVLLIVYPMKLVFFILMLHSRTRTPPLKMNIIHVDPEKKNNNNILHHLTQTRVSSQHQKQKAKQTKKRDEYEY